MLNLHLLFRSASANIHLIRFLSLLFVSVLLSGCAEPPYTNLDNAQLKTMLEKGTPMYDIRRPDEWRQTGVVADSRRLTFVDGAGRLKPDFFERFTAAVKKDDPVILICRTGSRTDVLARHLVEKMGYTRVYNVRNGITSWISERHQVVRL